MKNNNKKIELLNIAYQMFVANGYEKTSIDDIVAKANIAKGTYYYYFESKEQTLEEVIDMMINKEVEIAKQVLNSDYSVENKLVGIILAMQPAGHEIKVQEEISKPENIIMHQKIKNKIISQVTPLLSDVVQEGIDKKIFDCTNIEERIKMILIFSNELFDDKDISEDSIETFIDITEKILGAKSGTLSFIRKLIKKEGDSN